MHENTESQTDDQPADHKPTGDDPSIDDQWVALHQRSIRLFDQWLTLVEQALPDTVPDLRKSTEIVNIFTVLRRMLEIRKFQQNLMTTGETMDEEDDESHLQKKADEALNDAIRLLDPELFGPGISRSPD